MVDESKKPEWANAPEWAAHLAMDEDGRWWWFEEKPEFSPRDGNWYCSDGRSMAATPAAMSLEARP